MSKAATDVYAGGPLTAYSEDEQMFRASVREFAEREIRPRLAADTVGAYALSEAGSGSDAFALATRAVDRGDHYELNGQKLWITNGNEAGILIVFANANPDAGYRGITAFVVEKSFEGFSV